MKFSEFYRFIEAHGWRLVTGKGGGTRHHKYVHPDYPFSVPVGRHPSQEIRPQLLDKMLRELNLKEEYKRKRR